MARSRLSSALSISPWARLLLLAPVLALLACTTQPSGAGPATPGAQTAVPAEEGGTERVLMVAIYTPEPLSAAAREGIATQAEKRLPGVAVVRSLDVAKPEGSALLLLSPSIEELPPPSEDEIGYFSRGLTAEDVPPVLASRGVVVLVLRLRGDAKFTRLRAAHELVREVAAANRGAIWSQSARLLYTPKSWAEREASWEADLPDVRRNIAIHYYETEGRHRAVTLGMAPFGVPDLVMEDVPPFQSDVASVLVNACAQLLIEGAVPDAEGRLEVDLQAIRHTALRSFALAAKQDNGTGRSKVRLVPGRRDEGDPDNDLLEIVFDDHAGDTAPERQAAGLVQLLGGSVTDITMVSAGDPELEAVARKTQARIQDLFAMVKKGMPLGQGLSVKAPFPTDDESQEWMWVEVEGTRAGQFVGSLRNSPRKIAGLKLGAKVAVPLDDIADYLLEKPDGTTEGGESMDILLKRAPQPK